MKLSKRLKRSNRSLATHIIGYYSGGHEVSIAYALLKYLPTEYSNTSQGYVAVTCAVDTLNFICLNDAKIVLLRPLPTGASHSSISSYQHTELRKKIARTIIHRRYGV